MLFYQLCDRHKRHVLRYLWSWSDEFVRVHDDAQRMVRWICQVKQPRNPPLDLILVQADNGWGPGKLSKSDTLQPPSALL
jgi:hypothetical protein